MNAKTDIRFETKWNGQRVIIAQVQMLFKDVY